MIKMLLPLPRATEFLNAKPQLLHKGGAQKGPEPRRTQARFFISSTPFPKELTEPISASMSPG
jgi:hypothetical protein